KNAVPEPAPVEYVAKPFVPNEKPTYHGDIAHLVDRRCIECHHEGGPAPFALDNFKAVAARSAMIRRVVEDGTMPPWFMAPGVGKWKHDRSLSDGERASVGKWIANGLAEGNPSDSPKPRTFPKEWVIGTPDRILKPDKPIAIPATGTIPMVDYEIALNNSEPLWVEATQVIPGDPRVVHHVAVTIKVRDDRGNASNAGYLATWSPGAPPRIQPKGSAMRIPANAVLNFNMHYTPFGEAANDSTRLGLRLAKGPVHTEQQSLNFSNNWRRLRIPAGAANYRVSATFGLPADIDLASVLPHAHYRGKSMRLERLGADGKSEILVDVPRYDFNWQLDYEPEPPIRLRKGDVVRLTCVFDNSAG
ncbi:MAG: redoxin, partial [Armatimonadaceae bacterium]